MIRIALCGLYGAFATIAGKIALSDTIVITHLNHQCATQFSLSQSHCDSGVLLFRVMLFALMIFCNGLMISQFLKALEKNSSLSVTVISSAVNFLFTGMAGNIILRENLGLRWILGATLILAGILMITISQGDSRRARS
jgi:drug/metabolite transporter (DMT)-like permease